jgi:anti-sigma regulatory factor (Ser/Thr protein kinase)
VNQTATRLLVPNDAAYLRILGSYVAEVARQAGLPEDEVVRVRLAVEEAGANVIKHAYRPGATAHFHVTCETTADQLRIAVWDGGPAFDLAGIPEPHLQADVTRRRVGGLGLHLIRRWMDEVYVCPGPEGKELVLIKHLGHRKEGGKL